ncbi:MAG: DUF6178 family protein [Anaeromyxobacter sp.]
MTSPERPDRRLAPAELRDARTALAAARGRQRLDLILEARDPQALVRALPADELYLVIRDVGFQDAAGLVPLASVGQFKTLLDLDAWAGDHFEPAKALPWLRAARAGSLTDPKAASRWAAKLTGIDREVLYLTLRETLRVHDLEQDEDPELESTHFLRTPENKFVVEFLVEGAEYSAVRGVVDDLYAEDPFAASRLMSSLRFELPSELEETALRWRAGRLADLGYPPLEEALSWFARPPRTASEPAPSGAPARPGGFLLAELDKGTLLDRAVAALEPDPKDAVHAELVTAANAVLVANRVDPGDPERVREALSEARGLVELGLDLRARAASGSAADDVRVAAAALAEVPLKRIFQEGFGRLLELRWRAEKVLAVDGAPEKLGSPLAEAVAALKPKRPRYFPGLEAPREEWGTPMSGAFEPRPFRTPEELRRTTAALDEAERKVGGAA